MLPISFAVSINSAGVYLNLVFREFIKSSARSSEVAADTEDFFGQNRNIISIFYQNTISIKAVDGFFFTTRTIFQREQQSMNSK